MPSKSFARDAGYFFPLLISLFIVSSVLITNETKAGRNYYLSSSTGDDSRTSTQAQSSATPWKTIAKLNGSTFLPGDSILLKRGDVWHETFIVPSSGNSSSPIIISSYGSGANPILTGFSTITGWTDEGGGLFSKTIIVESSILNLVTVDGRNTGMGRYPNTGWLTYESNNANLSITDNQLSGTPNWTGAEAVIRKNKWMLDRNTITNHSATTLTYTTGSPWTPKASYGYFIQNSLSTLDIPGEWYYNGTKFYIFFGPVDPTTKTVKIATINRLAYINNKSYITFDRLAFEGANTVALQNTSGKNIVIQNCTFNFSGKDAVYIDNTVSSGATMTIDGNTINNSNECALRLRGTTSNTWVKNNSINNTGIIPGSGSSDDDTYDAIVIYGANSIIENNTIDSSGHNGIGIRTSSGITARYNYITYFGLTRYDAGGIYSWNANSNVTSRTFTKNIILHSKQTSEGVGSVTELSLYGIYLDEYTTNTLVSYNTVAYCHDAGIHILNSADDNIENNVCFDNGYQFSLVHAWNYGVAITGLLVKNNIFLSKTNAQPAFYFRDDSNPFSAFGTADNNYYARPIDDNLVIRTSINGSNTNRNLANWQSLSTQDMQSKKSPVNITNTSDLRFEYNATNTNKVVSLGSSYIDVTDTIYTNSITIPPYSSVILIKSQSTETNSPPSILNQNFQLNENSPNGTNVGKVIATDPDAGQILTYSITSGNTNGTFTINSSTGVLTVANFAALNFELTPIFTLVIKVQDNGSGILSSQANITISLVDINEAPVITNQSLSIAENSANGANVGTVIATDPDAGQTKAFSILSGNTNGAFVINASNGLLTVANSSTLNFEVTPTFSLVVKVQDNGTGNLSSQATITVSLVNVNESPVITNQSFSVSENTLNGTTVGNVVASDPDAGQTRTFSIISGNTNAAFSINPSSGVLSVANSAALNFEVTLTFSLVIKVQDNGVGSLSNQATISISVLDINEAPVITNQSFYIAENSVNGATIGNIVATDSDAGQIKTFSIVSGNTNGAFGINASTGNLSVANSAALNFEVTPTFAFIIKVQDNGAGNLSSQATVTVSLLDVNELPVINNQSFSIAENLANGSNVGTITATDPDAGQTKTFSIVSGNTSGAFTINASTGNLSVANSATLNFEVTPTFTLIVKAQDNGTGNLSSQATVTVSLLDMNELPVINNQSFSIVENSANGSNVGTIIATDPDAGQTKTFSIVSGNTNGAFVINASSGILSVANSAALNFEVTPIFALIVKVQDNGIGNLSSQATITISLVDINEAPVISNQSFSIAENAANGTTIGTIVATDPDAGQIKSFSIVSGNTNGAFIVNESTGILTVANTSALNFESAPSIALVVKVQDNGVGNLSNQATITISVLDMNEAPVIANQSFSIVENAVNGTSVGTVMASDPDAGQALSYSIISGNTNGAFTIHATTGVLTVANSSAVNFENTPSFGLIIKVQDNGTGNISSTATITISIADINEIPVITNQSFSIAENSANGTLVGNVVASDPDAGQTKTFSIISENTSGALTINPSTGVLTVATSAALNFENLTSFALVIKVQDNGVGNLSNQATVTISLTDVNEAPEISNQSFSVDENSANGTTVGIVIASDPDAAQTKAFSIVSGNTGGGFVINAATGILTVANSSALNFESTQSFILVIRVQDNGSGNLSSFANISVTLNDINEAPVINNQNFNVLEFSSNGTIVGYINATDPDAGQSLSYIILSGNTGNAFAINALTGELKVSNSTALNLSINPTFALSIKITDNGIGNLSTSAIVNVIISQTSNQVPVITNQLFSIAENSANTSIVGNVIAFDPDAGQTKNFSIVSGNTNSAFIINASTGVLTVANSTALNFEITPSFSLAIQVQDNGVGNLSSQATITVSLTDINEAPVLTDQSFSVNENSVNGTQVGTVLATDPDAGQTKTLSIISGNTNGTFAINASTGILTVANSTALNFEVTPTFSLVVKVQDNGVGNLSSQAIITISLIDINEVPFIANQSFSVAENSATGTSVGTIVASDPDAGQIKTFTIVSGNIGGAFAINPASGILTVANSTALDFESTPSFSLIIKVQDNGAGTLNNQSTITISLIDINEMPVIVNQLFPVAENSVNGTNVGTVIASDPDAGQITTFTIISGNTGGAFAINSASGILTVTNSAALNFEVTPTFSLVVKVKDNGVGNLSSQATVTISLIDINEVPIITNQSFSLAENSSNGTSVGTIIATDPDAGQTKTYSIISGNFNAAFALNASTGVLTVANSTELNFEATPTFSLVVKVQDNGVGNLSSQAIITISLLDINEMPVITNQSFSVAENSAIGTSVGTVLASDPDSGQTKSFSIVSGNTNGAFAINASSGLLTVVNNEVLNFQVSPTFALVVKVQDNGTGNLSSQATITISLADINEMPIITNQSFSVAENSANGTIVGTVIASDPDAAQTKTFSIVSSNSSGAFAINSTTGILTVASSEILNFENITSIALIIKVQDNGVGNLSSQATITVSIIDINEEPAISNQSFIVSEKSALGTIIGKVVASDPDAGQAMSFSIISGNINGAFAINPSTGLISVANKAALNYQVSSSFALVVKVQDNGTGNLSNQATITISLTDMNEAPVITDQSFSVAENSVLGTTVGTVIATDPDANQTMTFSIVSGDTNGAVSINASSGELTVANSSVLDFESTISLSFIVKVQDNGAGNLSSQATITVWLADVNEMPVIPDQSFSVIESATKGTTVGSIEVSEPDAGQSHFYFIITGNTNNAFSLNALTGELTVNTASALTQGISSPFLLGILVFDNGTGNLYNTGIVSVNVISSQNQPPVINDQTLSVNQDSPSGTSVGIVEATDPNAEQILTYSILTGNTNGAFTINSSTGEIVVANSTALGLESAPSIDLVIKVQDNSQYNLSSQANVTILILMPDMPPVVLNQIKSTIEHQPIGTVVGYVSAFDPNSKSSLKYSIASGNISDGFSLDTISGCITIHNPNAVCFEGHPVFNLIVHVEDNVGLSSEATITINVEDINETPVCTSQIFSIAENSPAQIIAGTIVAKDFDLNQTLTYSIVSGNTNGAFTVNPTDGTITVINSSALNFEANEKFDLIVSVQDNGIGNLIAFSDITIGLLDVNEPPVMENQALSVIENATPGTQIGYLKAEDPDKGQVVKFKIVGGNDSHTFNLDDYTGLVSVADPSILVYGKNSLFALSVIAQDNSTDSLSTLSVITIHLVKDTTQYGLPEKEISPVAEVFDESAISIYPNPTADVVNINLEKVEQQAVGIRIISMNGSEIYSSLTNGEKNVKINMENQRAGTYIAQISANGHIFDKKIIVQN